MAAAGFYYDGVFQLLLLFKFQTSNLPPQLSVTLRHGTLCSTSISTTAPQQMAYMYTIPNHTRNNSPAKLFYLSFKVGQMAVCVFIVAEHYINGKKLIYHL